MRAHLLLKLTVSSLVLSTIACSPFAQNGRVANLMTPAADASKGEAKLFEETQLAVQAGRTADALLLAERLVETAPRDAGYRLLLGDLYLKSGRFASAEAAFGDVARLDPANVRAALSLALVQIAQGNSLQAYAGLDRLEGVAAPADLGLAYALAGRTDRALALLETAAAAQGADGRVRQNLALTYALVGDWGKARVIASQDVNPADLAGRLQGWADLANPANAGSRVQRLLGVEAVADTGYPTHLALRDEAPALVEAAPVEVVPAAKPVEVAGYPAPVVNAPVEARFEAAAETLIKADPVAFKAPVRITAEPIPAFQPAKRDKLAAVAKLGGRYVVQIGAFGNAALAQQGWSRAARRFNLAADLKPHSTTVTIPGKGVFHRLSIGGFDGPAEAARLCRSIRAKGGACFVRTRAGDTLAAWAGQGSRRG